jgi:hypothetical protein
MFGIMRRRIEKFGKIAGRIRTFGISGRKVRIAFCVHHKLAPSLYECFYNTLTICSTFNVDTIIDMMLR